VLGGETRGSYVGLYVECSRVFLVQRLREFPTSLQFVLKVVIYTGKSTYSATSSDQQEKKKTVQVVEQLVKPFVRTHQTIYADCFYTSVDLLKSLSDKNLYLTDGTMLANGKQNSSFDLDSQDIGYF
jgi:hypothetical protein